MPRWWPPAMNVWEKLGRGRKGKPFCTAGGASSSSHSTRGPSAQRPSVRGPLLGNILISLARSALRLRAVAPRIWWGLVTAHVVVARVLRVLQARGMAARRANSGCSPGAGLARTVAARKARALSGLMKRPRPTDDPARGAERLALTPPPQLF